MIYWQPVGNGELVIAVGQELEYREELVNKMVFSQTGIWFAGLPVLLLVAFIVIYRALKPINRLSRNVQVRRPGDVSLLETDDVPTEILPLVQNLNQFSHVPVSSWNGSVALFLMQRMNYVVH